MNQPSLLDTVHIEPIDPHLTAAEKPRLSKQCAAILTRLQQGPATNRELARLALKYTSRLSDLRAAGYLITVVARDTSTGLVTYQIGGRA